MIKTDDSSIADILKKDSVVYSVPEYQRGFDWGKQELQELVEDFKESVATDNKLYLGSLIFDVSDDKASATNNYQIVDGQQRITTISIILVAIRRQFLALNENRLADRVRTLIDDDSPVITDTDSRKLIASENIRDIYNYISDYDWDGVFPDKIGAKSVKRQVNKVKPIYDYVTSSIEKYNAEELNKFYTALLNSYVVVINVQSIDDVFAIFERTNARGLDLNIGDLLKNFIFQKGGVESYKEEWDEVVANASGSLQRMLKYFWVSRRGHTQSSQLYRNLKTYSAEKEDIGEFVAELVEFSKFYLATQSNSKIDIRDWLYEFGLDEVAKNEDYYTKIARSLQALKLFRVTQAYPVLFSMCLFFRSDESASPKQLIAAVSAVEKYHFVNNVIGGRVGNEVEKFYSAQAVELFLETSGFNERINQFISELSQKKIPKEEFAAKFNDINDSLTYAVNSVPLIMYLFDRINNHNVKGAQYVEIYNPDTLTKVKNYNIEHLLAQSHEYKFGIDRETIDSIGNLIVVPRHTNPLLGDKSVTEKIRVLREDPKRRGSLLILDQLVEQYSDLDDENSWGEAKIEARTTELSKLSYEKVWSF